MQILYNVLNLPECVKQNGTVQEQNDYYPYGGRHTSGNTYAALPGNTHKFNGKEEQTTGNLGYLDYGARMYDNVTGRWGTPDPLAEKYKSLSPYNYCLNNPVKFVDPDERAPSTEVELLKKGIYKVVNGKADGDLNIYVTQNGQRTGEILGKSLTEYSFLNDAGNAVKGAVINMNDHSGQDFLNTEIIQDNPSLLKYIGNARNNQVYDFKSRGSESRNKEDIDQFYYRGMTMQYNGEYVYASARDIGNYGAGYIAGKNGLSWNLTRAGFDGLQSMISTKLTTEGQPSQQAQKIGYDTGRAALIVNIMLMLFGK